MRHDWRERVTRAVITAAVLACSGWVATAAAVEWPQQIEAPEGKIVVYQPQPESLEGDTLKGRAAMSLELTDKTEPIFGTFWFTARVDTDRDSDTVLIRDLTVDQVRWPDSKDPAEQRFTQVVEQAVPGNGFSISLSRLTASLATAATEKRSLEDLKSDPPKIIFSSQLAVLLLYDGPPKFTDIPGSAYERAMNTPLAVARSKTTQDVYLSSGTLWYRAKSPLGPFTSIASPPADLAKLVPSPKEGQPPPVTPPTIVVATEPTEVISTQGAPNWASLSGGKILYVTNTETPWLRDLPTGNMYVLLSGRWYRSQSENGPWTFVPATQLPESFKDIPPGSEIGGLRASVAGTQEANEAVLDAQVPQTAAIKRSEAKLEVHYDGQPRFEGIPGTKVSYAVNTSSQVLEIAGKFYAVDNGVWFTAAAATGPWVVADSIPQDEISKIPPSSPVYNTTYVSIYDSTPDVVYVGYLPGYLWSFPYYGVPVYGTGWYYPPYWGGFYYPRPFTWGFSVGYNPWTGWSFGLSWSNGFFSFGVRWGGGYPGYYHPGGCCGGWYGGGYHGPVFVNNGNINIGNSVSVGNRTNIGNRIEREGTSGGRLSDRNTNLYKQPGNLARNAGPATAGRTVPQARAAPGRANDVYADKNGTVARRDGNDWEVRNQDGWSKADFPQQTGDRLPGIGTGERDQSAGQRGQWGSGGGSSARSEFDRGDLDRAFDARQRGAARERSGGMSFRGRR